MGKCHRNTVVRAALLGVLWVASEADVGLAQRPPADPPPGTVVRVETHDGVTVEGRLWKADVRHLFVVDERDVEHVIARGDVSHYWREATRAGSIAAGAAPITATGLGLFVGALASALCDQAVCEGQFTSGFARAAPVGAAAGAVVGSLVGLAFHRWLPVEPSAPVRRHPIAWSLHFGEVFGPDDGPDPVTMARAKLGWNARRSLAIYGEVVHIGYATTQRVFDPYVPISAFADEDAHTLSFLLGAALRLDDGDHIRVSIGAGVARSKLVSLVSEPTGFGFSGRLETLSRGVHIGAGLDAGWSLGMDSSVRVGFEGRADWIPSAPLNELPMLTLSMAVWG